MVENVYFKVQKVYCVILSRDFQIEDFKCQYEWSIQDNYFIEPTKLISRDTPESLSMVHQSWGSWNCDRIIWNNMDYRGRTICNKDCAYDYSMQGISSKGPWTFPYKDGCNTLKADLWGRKNVPWPLVWWSNYVWTLCLFLKPADFCSWRHSNVFKIFEPGTGL